MAENQKKKGRQKDLAGNVAESKPDVPGHRGRARPTRNKELSREKKKKPNGALRVVGAEKRGGVLNVKGTWTPSKVLEGGGSRRVYESFDIALGKRSSSIAEG